ncbi:MAG: hypothetical protein HY823_07235 [Acidobacteria bacterium]|nr:hypothetical protein [Acidobacteriota bacterium]
MILRTGSLLLAGAMLFAQGNEWERALQNARRFMEKGGRAVVVMLHRTDPSTVKVQVAALGSSFREIRCMAHGAKGGQEALALESARAMDQMEGAALLDEQTTDMEVSLKGEDLRPRIRLRVPRQGEAPQIGTILAGTAPESGLSVKSKI